MYIQGVSTRKVKAITEELCGHEFSPSTISNINKTLDDQLEAFSQRLLNEAYPYVILDARYEKVREGGRCCNTSSPYCSRSELGWEKRSFGSRTCK